MNLDLAKIRETAEKATPGPWNSGFTHAITGPSAVQLYWSEDDDYERNENGMVQFQYPVGNLGYPHYGIVCRTMPDTTNADFIATCNPQTVIALLDLIESMKNCGNCRYISPRGGFCKGCDGISLWKLDE